MAHQLVKSRPKSEGLNPRGQLGLDLWGQKAVGREANADAFKYRPTATAEMNTCSSLRLTAWQAR